MNRKWTILSCLLTLALLSGCEAVLLHPENPTEGYSEDYKAGHLNGFEVASNSGEALAAGMRGDISYTPSKLPDAVLRKIQDNDSGLAKLHPGEEERMVAVVFLSKLTDSVSVVQAACDLR